MSQWIIQFLQLGILANLGVFLGCKIAGYELETPRRVIAATAFALLYSLPLGILVHFLSPLALWKLLERPGSDQRGRGTVIVMTYLVAGLATMLLFHLTRGS